MITIDKAATSFFSQFSLDGVRVVHFLLQNSETEMEIAGEILYTKIKKSTKPSELFIQIPHKLPKLHEINTQIYLFMKRNPRNSSRTSGSSLEMYSKILQLFPPRMKPTCSLPFLVLCAA